MSREAWPLVTRVREPWHAYADGAYGPPRRPPRSLLSGNRDSSSILYRVWSGSMRRTSKKSRIVNKMETFLAALLSLLDINLQVNLHIFVFFPCFSHIFHVPSPISPSLLDFSNREGRFFFDTHGREAYGKRQKNFLAVAAKGPMVRFFVFLGGCGGRAYGGSQHSRRRSL